MAQTITALGLAEYIADEIAENVDKWFGRAGEFDADATLFNCAVAGEKPEVADFDQPQEIVVTVPEGVFRITVRRQTEEHGTAAEELRLIQQTRIVGNAYHDQALMNRIHDLVMDSAHPVALKMKALEKLNEVMGETSPITEQSVQEYIDAF